MNLFSLYAKFVKKCRLSYIYNSKKDKTAKIFSGSTVVNSSLGRYSYCSYDCKLLNVKIGNFCSIAEGVVIGGASHPLTWVSTSPVFIKGRNPLKKNIGMLEYNAFKNTYIGNDVWIGERAIVKAGLSIGNGAIIGMGSVVTHDVPSYSIVAGNPAKLIRMRFDEKTIASLEKLEWWTYSDKQLKELAKKMNDVESFLSIREKV